MSGDKIAKRRKVAHASRGPVSKPKDKTASPGPAQEDAESSSGDNAHRSEKDDQKHQRRNEEEEEEQGTETEAPKTFRDLGVVDTLAEACAALKYDRPTQIQAESIPIALQGKDIVGLAETGSGKTAAFALPILQALLDKPQPLFSLVLAPTRELAFQIGKTFEALGAIISLRVCTIVGGMDFTPQQVALGKKPHVVVATPGRILDHLERTKGFSFRALKYLVLDEADRLLELEFGPVIEVSSGPTLLFGVVFQLTVSRKSSSLCHVNGTLSSSVPP